MYRYLFATAACVITYLLFRKRFRLTIQPSPWLLLVAVFYVGFMGLQVAGLLYCTSIVAAIIFACVPILVMAMARVFLKEHVSRAQMAGILVGAATVIYVVLRGGGEVEFRWQGVVLMMLSAISLTVYSLLLRGKRSEFHPFQVSFYCSVTGAVVLTLVGVLHCMRNGSAAELLAPVQEPTFLISTLYLGVCCILVSALLMAYSAARLPAVKTSAFNNISTVISILAGALLLREPLYDYEIIGAVIIIACVLIVNALGNKKLPH